MSTETVLTDEKKLDGKEIQLLFAEIMDDYKSGDIARRDNAIKEAYKYLDKFVWNIINKQFRNYGAHKEDMHSEGTIGWMEALNGYDPSKSAPTTYFYAHILHRIQAYVTDNIMNMTPYYNNVAKQIKRIQNELDAAGVAYDECIIAEQTGLPLETIRNTLKYMENSVRVNYDPSLSMTSEVYDAPEVQMIKEESEKELLSLLSDLTPFEAEIFSKLHGLNGEKSTSKVIAKMLTALSQNSRKKYNIPCNLKEDTKLNSQVEQFKILLGYLLPGNSEAIELFDKCIQKAATASAKDVKKIQIGFCTYLKTHCSQEDCEKLCTVLTSDDLIRQKMVVITRTHIKEIDRHIAKKLRGKQTIIEKDIVSSVEIENISMDEIHEDMSYLEQIPIEELQIL